MLSKCPGKTKTKLKNRRWNRNKNKKSSPGFLCTIQMPYTTLIIQNGGVYNVTTDFVIRVLNVGLNTS